MSSFPVYELTSFGPTPDDDVLRRPAKSERREEPEYVGHMEAAGGGCYGV